MAATMLMMILSPVLCSAEVMEMCSSMMGHENHSGPNSDIEHMEMVHQPQFDHQAHSSMVMGDENCETKIECSCVNPVSDTLNDATITAKLQIPQITISVSTNDLPEKPEPTPPFPVWYSNSYHPPSLFLANESFLI